MACTAESELSWQRRMKLCLVMAPRPLKTLGTIVPIAAIAFIVEVAAVVGHHIAFHHVGVHHGVGQRIGVDNVPAGVGHHVALLIFGLMVGMGEPY